MHVYLRDEKVNLRMAAVDAPELIPEDSELVPMAFYVEENDQPSFRALLPPDTIEVLRDALGGPVTLGLLAEEPTEAGEEIHAVVGLAVPINEDHLPKGADDSPEEAEPWRASVGSSEAWRGDQHAPDEAGAEPRTALLAFAPLIRLNRRFPADFAEELADLLESALSGSTRPALEARVDRLLDDL